MSDLDSWVSNARLVDRKTPIDENGHAGFINDLPTLYGEAAFVGSI